MSRKNANREQLILALFKGQEGLSVAEVQELYKQHEQLSHRSLNRIITQLVTKGELTKLGDSHATRYKLSHTNLEEIELYFQRSRDERAPRPRFNWMIFDDFTNRQIFTNNELEDLTRLTADFQTRIKHLPPAIMKREFERLTIELSWKSSQIEGNTYDVLETEALLLYRQQARGKTQEEADMIINHKQALDMIASCPEHFAELSLAKILELHQSITANLNIYSGIRTKAVGISGTNYIPLLREVEIYEALEKLVLLINSKQSCFDKSLLAILMIAYIQAFEDGNKRTSRMLANALLMAYTACPLSFRTVNVLEYKKALMYFYEQNDFSYFKKLFIEQYVFAVTNYWR